MNFSYKGKILISTPDISGDIFSRSVVLIIEHDENGAFGLILNKKNTEIESNLLNILDLPIEIFNGGPVENDKIFIIVKGTPTNEFALKIDEQYYLTEDILTILTELLENQLSISDIKLFSGYSGWSAQQLESEISRKLWIPIEHYQLDYTSSHHQSLWKKMMENLGGKFLIWANTPEDVSMN